MFENTGGLVAADEAEICKRDYEKDLQRERKKLEEYDKALNLMEQLQAIEIYMEERKTDPLIEFIGKLQVGAWACNKRINHYLEMIDKEAAKD